ncbi:MAG: methyl-accepting chemotaxis protein [Spirochaetota bacterium]
MKIRTALVVLLIVNVLSLVALGAFALVVGSQMESAYEFQQAARRVDAAVWKLQARTYATFDTSSLRLAHDKWEGAVDEYETAHAELLEAAQNTRLQSEAVSSRVDSLSAYVSQVQDQFELISEQAETAEAQGFSWDGRGFTQRMLDDPPFEVVQLKEGLETLTTFLDETESTLIGQLIQAYALELDTLQNRRMLAIVIGGLVVIGLTVLYVSLFARRLYRNVSNLDETIASLSAGDLTVRFETQGNNEIASIAARLQQHVDEFSSVLRQVQQSVDESQRLKENLTGTTEESSASVEQMSANIDSIGKQIASLDEQISSTGAAVSDIFDRVKVLTEQMDEQSSASEESSSAVHEMAASIDNVAKIAAARTDASDRLNTVTRNGSEKVESTNAVIQKIAESVDEIKEIIGIINKIAGQTSILSMNAAIEAAHAGDYGRGFAVVAEEIRKLSESTNKNAKQIRSSLEEISQSAVEAQQLSAASTSAFGEINSEVQRFIESLSEISSSTEELSSGTQQMLQATDGLTQTTERIREVGTEINAQTQTIDESMKGLRNVSGEVNQAVSELSAGTREISQAMLGLNATSGKTSEQIDVLARSISRFHLDDRHEDDRQRTEETPEGNAVSDDSEIPEAAESPDEHG